MYITDLLLRRAVLVIGILAVFSLFGSLYTRYPARLVDIQPTFFETIQNCSCVNGTHSSDAKTDVHVAPSVPPYIAKTTPRKDLLVQMLTTPQPVHACSLKQYDMFDKKIISNYFSGSPKTCPASSKPYFIITRIHKDVGKSSAVVNKTILETVYNTTELPNNACNYTILSRDMTKNNIDRNFVESQAYALTFEKPLDAEYIWITCKLNDTSYEQPLLLPMIKEEDKVFKTNKIPLNVLIFGIDSISSFAFPRVLPQTYKYLKSKKNLIELRLYNKIGRNSAPNQGAILSGDVFEGAVENRAEREDWHFDNASRYIWDDFKDMGFRTMFFEEQWYWGLFVYGSMKGFIKQPTTYWPLPILQKIDSSPEKKATKDYCNGGKYSAEYYMTYTSQLMELLGPTRPLFSYIWLSEMVHDDIRGGIRLDKPSLEFLIHLEKSGVMNNTAVFFISDHGFNFGSYITNEQGSYENKLPFAYVMFPEWFYQERPHVLENLKINQNRLLTALDLHATLLELSNIWYPGRPVRTHNGESILSNELSPLRTCRQLTIPVDYCSCYESVKLEIKNSISLNISNFIVNFVNNQILSDNTTAKSCEHFEMNSTISAYALINRGYHNLSSEIYRVTVSTVPDALFEAVVHVGGHNSTMTIETQVVRVDRFDEKAKCLQDGPLKKFCYCKNR